MKSVADEEQKDVKYRLGRDAEIALYFIAALFDLMTFIIDIVGIILAVVGVGIALVGINSIIGIVGECLLAFLFFLNGVSPFSQKIAIRYVGAFVIKMLPFIGGLVPALIWTVFMVVFWSREEDKHPAIKAAEQAVAAKAFSRSKTPEGDAKAVDNRVAAFARSRGGDQGREFGKDLRGAGNNKPTFGQRNAANAERLQGIKGIKDVGSAGTKAGEVGTSAISRNDLGLDRMMGGRRATNQSVDGVVPAGGNDSTSEEAAAT
jgi:hypothetical protein